MNSRTARFEQAIKANLRGWVMEIEPKKETPDPGTAAEDGRRAPGVHKADNQPVLVEVQNLFYGAVSRVLSVEWMKSYVGDGVNTTVTLARYTSAPMGQNVIAQGNALGNSPTSIHQP